MAQKKSAGLAAGVSGDEVRGLTVGSHVSSGSAWYRRQVHQMGTLPLPISAKSGKRPDTVGEFKSAEICVLHMPSWKAKTLGKLT